MSKNIKLNTVQFNIDNGLYGFLCNEKPYKAAFVLDSSSLLPEQIHKNTNTPNIEHITDTLCIRKT